MTQVLIIEQPERDEIKRVREYAERHPLSLEDMQRAVARGVAIGDDPNFTCELRMGFLVTFTVEQQPFGLSRHISVSVAKPECWPPPSAVELIMAAFGFRGGVAEAVAVYSEDARRAINVIELADPTGLAQGVNN